MEKRKIIMIIAIIVILIVIGILVFLKLNPHKETFEEKLIDIGYSQSAAKVISESVSLTDQDLILNFGKNDSILELLTAKDYKEKNLETYLEYLEKNKKAPVEDIIIIVNSEYDILDRTYNTLLVSLIQEKYFIFDNLDRYIEYSKNNDYTPSEIVTNINSNLDKEKYQDTEKSDTKDDNLVLVNKYYYLEKDYEPTDLVTLTSKYNSGNNSKMRRDAANAFMKMADAATLDNISIKNASGYRSYNYQNTLYDNYVKRDGQAAADTYSARPGSSEHQAGLATDINEISASFENTDAFKWLEKNADKYGFILRYPKDKEHITGYNYEPWHYRYVGKDVAKQIKEENITFEEYYAYYVSQEKE